MKIRKKGCNELTQHAVQGAVLLVHGLGGTGVVQRPAEGATLQPIVSWTSRKQLVDRTNLHWFGSTTVSSARPGRAGCSVVSRARN